MSQATHTLDSPKARPRVTDQLGRRPELGATLPHGTVHEWERTTAHQLNRAPDALNECGSEYLTLVSLASTVMRLLILPFLVSLAPRGKLVRPGVRETVMLSPILGTVFSAWTQGCAS